jgi:hypothetical protein
MAALATYHAVRAVIASSPPKETEAARQIADGCYARFAEVGDVGLSRLVQRPALQPEMRDAMDSDIRRLFEQTTAESGAIGPPIDVSSRGPLNGYWVAGTPEWYVAGRQLIEARRESLAQARSQLVAGARDLDEDDREALRQLCEGLGHSWSVSNDDWEDLSVASLALRWEMIWRLRPDFPEEIQPHNPFLLLGDAARFFPEEGNSEAVALVASALRFDVTDPLPLEPMLQEYRRAVLAHQKYLDEPTPPKRVSMRDSRIEDGAERISRILLRGELEPSLTVLKTYIALTQQSIPVEASPAARAVSLARLFSDDLAPLLALTYWRLRTERLDALLELIEASANQAELPGRALRQILESKQGRRDVLVEVFLGVAKEAAKMRATIASGLPERLQS